MVSKKAPVSRTPTYPKFYRIGTHVHIIWYVTGIVIADRIKKLSLIGSDLLLGLPADDDNTFFLYYLRGGLHGVIVLCHHVCLQNHIAVILINVGMGGVTNVVSRGNIPIFT